MDATKSGNLCTMGGSGGDGAGEAAVSLHLDRSPLSVRTARRAMLQLLGDGPSIEFVRDAVLLTSELVSNAIMHTTGACSLHATYRQHPDRLRVEISDESPVPAVIRDSPDAPPRGGGLGLRLVDDVATEWGTERRGDGGKMVWFEMHAS